MILHLISSPMYFPSVIFHVTGILFVQSVDPFNLFAL